MWIADAGLERGITRTSHIRIVRPGEVGLELKAVREPLFDSGLQRVVAGRGCGLDLDNLGEVCISRSYVGAVRRIYCAARRANKAAGVLIDGGCLVEGLGADIRQVENELTAE